MISYEDNGLVSCKMGFLRLTSSSWDDWLEDRLIRAKTAIWYELNCNTSIQKINSGCHALPIIRSISVGIL